METQTDKREVVLRVDDVCHSYGDKPVLDHVSFEVYRGEVFFVVGGSASGKTTLLRVCAGLEEPTSGSVAIIEHKDLDEDMPMSVGFVFQQHGLISNMSVFDNIALPLRYHTDLDEEVIRERVEDALRSTGALEAMTMRPDYLSLGLQRRVGVARAVVQHPDIIFYDDPILGLDHVNAAAVAQLIKEMNEEHGVTSVLVSHSLALASSLGDRVAVVTGGRIRDIGTLDELRHSENTETQKFLDSHQALWLQATKNLQEKTNDHSTKG